MPYNQHFDFFNRKTPDSAVECVPIIMPTMSNYCPDSRVQIRFMIPATLQSLSMDLPVDIADEFAQKILSGECFKWRAQTLKDHSEDFDFILMYQYTGKVELQDGIVHQTMEFGLDSSKSFILRVFRSEPNGDSEFRRFMQVLYPDFDLQNLGRQLDFVAGIIMDT